LPRTATEVVDLLDLEKIDDNLFRGSQPETSAQRVFGGQVAAQALMAASLTTPSEYVLHSMHSYFLRPGDPAVPIAYDVEHLREGRSFATRRVVARQHGRGIYFQTADFQRPEEGLIHQDPMPEVVGPEQSIRLADLFSEVGGDTERWMEEWSALDVRYVPDRSLDPSQTRLWLRVDGDLGTDPLIQAAAFTYASDLTLLGSALGPHPYSIDSPEIQAASLDHTVWFHRPFRADEWWLYDQYSPAANGGRGLALARVFSHTGELVASVAQEGLLRLAPGATS
jgi:acyl-CoA thioesterase II